MVQMWFRYGRQRAGPHHMSEAELVVCSTERAAEHSVDQIWFRYQIFEPATLAASVVDKGASSPIQARWCVSQWAVRCVHKRGIQVGDDVTRTTVPRIWHGSYHA